MCPNTFLNLKCSGKIDREKRKTKRNQTIPNQNKQINKQRKKKLKPAQGGSHYQNASEKAHRKVESAGQPHPNHCKPHVLQKPKNPVFSCGRTVVPQHLVVSCLCWTIVVGTSVWYQLSEVPMPNPWHRGWLFGRRMSQRGVAALGCASSPSVWRREHHSDAFPRRRALSLPTLPQ